MRPIYLKCLAFLLVVSQVYGAGFSGKHFMILSADRSHLWLAYYFGVTNDEAESKLISEPLLVPMNMIDFQPGDGLESEDLVPQEGGGLVFEKKVESGFHHFSMLIKVPVKSDELIQKLQFVPPTDIEELHILSHKDNGLDLQGAVFKPGFSSMMDPRKFKGIHTLKTAKGTNVVVEVLGIPKGWDHLWKLGFTFLVLLFGIAAILTMRSRHRNLAS